jgi:VanZ family protein
VLLPLRYGRAWLVISWIIVVMAVAVCLMPMNRLPLPAGANDKVEHTVAYVLLSLWFAGIYPRSRYPIIAISLFLMGVGIEFAQGAMHYGRQADFHDVIANSSGILVGLTLAFIGLGGWAQRIESLARRS